MFANAYTFHTMVEVLSLDLHPMKKLFLLALALPALFISMTSANCEDMSFSDADLCISIEKETSNRFQVDVDVEDANGTVSLLCDILLPNNNLVNVGACNGDFTYNGDDERTIKLYVRVNQQYKTLEATYDFDEGEWTDGDDDDDDDNNGDLDDFDIKLSPTTPETDEWTDVTIEAIDDDEDTIDDYEGTVVIKVQYKDGSTWRTLSDSKYDIEDINLDSNDEYDFDSSDNGEIEFQIKFDDEDEYRIVVEDEDENVEASKTFDVDDDGSSNNSNGDLDDFEISISPTSPETDETIDVTIEAVDDDGDTVDDYEGTVVITFQYKDGSTRKTLSESRYDIGGINLDNNDEYDFDSSDNGEIEFEIEYAYEDDYRILVEDEDEDITASKTFVVDDDGSSNSNSNGDLDDFDITLSPTTPETDEWTDVTIEAIDDDEDTIDDYEGTVVIKVQYKDGSTWRTLSDSKYDIEDINLDSNDEYDFDSSDNGEIEFQIKFDDEDEYRIVVEDEDENVEASKTFDVDDDGSSNNDDEDGDFDISISPSSPEEDEEIDVTIEALDSDGDLDDNYTEMVRFSVQRKSGSSWVTASSSDYDITRTSYTFTSSDDGEKLFTNMLTFNREGDFRLKVYESNNSSVYAYQEIEVDNGGSSSSSSNGFTSSERSQVRAIYNLWPDLIDELEDETPSLRNNSSRQDDQEDLYDEMKNIIDQDDSAYDDYDEFFDAFMDRYTDTLDIIN